MVNNSGRRKACLEPGAGTKLPGPGLRCAILSLALLAAFDAGAEGWRITPRLGVKETYTDNVTLGAQGKKQSELVTEVSPGVSVSKTGNRFNVNATYSLQTLSYLRDSSRNNTNHQLAAHADAEWIKDFFFTDASASISQQNTSLLGVAGADNINVTGNRTDVRTYQISPYIKSRLGNIADYRLGYTHNAVSTGATNISDSQAGRINAELNSAAAFYKVDWSLLYSRETINNSNVQDNRAERFAAGLRYLLSRKLNLVASYGYEKNSFLTTGAKPEGSLWDAGFVWTPSPRTKLEARVGRRYFGDTYLLDYTQRSRRTTWSVNYGEDVTSARSQFFAQTTIDTASLLDSQFSASIPDPAIRAQFVEDFIVQNGLQNSTLQSLNFLSNQTFLQKRLQGAVSLNGIRNTMIFSLYGLSRFAQATATADQPGDGDFILSRDVKQYGASALWSSRLTPRISSNLSVAYTRNQFKDTGREDDSTLIRFGVRKQFEKKTSGSVDLRRTERSSNQDGNDYKENAVTVSLDMRF